LRAARAHVSLLARVRCMARPPASRLSLLRVLLPVAAAAVALAPFPAAQVERLYSRGVYPSLQPPLTHASNLLPFAALDLMIVAVAAWILWRAAARWRERGGRLRRAGALAWDAAMCAACVYLLFVILWGLNYQRRPAEDRFDVDASRVTAERLTLLADLAVVRINALYEPRLADVAGGSLEDEAASLEPEFSRALERIGQRWRPVPGRPKASLVARLFPVAAVDGLMNPLALEVILNPEVLPFERPFLLAHEWAHLAGHARESEASFVAWLACLDGTRSHQYSGWLAAALHAARNLPDGRDFLDRRLTEGPRRDLEAIRHRLSRAKPVVYRTTWRVYDRYLRTQGVRSGVANYDEVTTLMLGSRHAADVVASPAAK
jgi:hypothetical protein